LERKFLLTIREHTLDQNDLSNHLLMTRQLVPKSNLLKTCGIRATEDEGIRPRNET